jgi:hypothetical protein
MQHLIPPRPFSEGDQAFSRTGLQGRIKFLIQGGEYKESATLLITERGDSLQTLFPLSDY